MPVHALKQGSKFVQAVGRIFGVIWTNIEVIYNRIRTAGEPLEQIGVIGGLIVAAILARIWEYFQTKQRFERA